MFNIGIGEVMLIALIALLIFGPNRLPEIMKSFGKAVRTFQLEGQKAREILQQGLEEKPTPNLPGVVDQPDPDARAETLRSIPPVADVPEAAREYEDT